MPYSTAYPFPQMVPSSQAPAPPNNLNASNTQESRFKDYASRHRRWLLPIFFTCLAGMIIGIVFVSHDHYHRLGGQGWLRVRSQGTGREAPKLFLPLRKLETYREIENSSSWFGWWKRAPRSVPFYTCGDQQKSCEAYNQPNVCCPVNMFCHPTSFTPSNIFCCNTTRGSECEATLTNPPQCLPDSIQCPENVGGGCCSPGTICTPNGCLENANVQSADSDIRTCQSTDGATISECGVAKTSADTSNDHSSESPRITGSPLTPMIVKTITVTEIAPSTSPKDGEIAQKGQAAKGSLIVALCAPYGPALALVIVAAMMGLL